MSLKTWLWRAHSFILQKGGSGRRWAIPFRRTRNLLAWLDNICIFRETRQANPASGWRGSTSEWGTCHPLPSWLSLQGCVGKSKAHVKEKQLQKGMRREKSLSSNQLVCLLLPFLSQTTGCLELIYGRPNPLQLSHSFGKLSFCCVVWCVFGLLRLLVR